MFEELLESTTAKRKRSNPWAYAVSLVLQVTMVGVLLLVPLLYTEALPQQQLMSMLLAPPPPPPPPPPPAAKPIRRPRRRVSLMEAGRLRAPKEIPKEIRIIEEEPLPADSDVVGVVGGVPGGVPGGQVGGVIGGVLGGVPSSAPPPPQETPKRIRVSAGVQEAKRVHYVKPVYPSIAKQARIQGTVRLQAIIGRNGRIKNLRVLEGHPLLTQAAVQAVQQWRYEPTLLNNVPVEVDTFIDVRFKLY